ncbi:MAG: hypothetical protein ACOZCO_13620 [Bacteroidota bacterium]
MKQIVTTTLAGVAVMATLFSGCKKGENDPFLSVHTRKARMTGDWKLTSGKTTETDYNSFSSTTTVTTTTFDGANASESMVVTTPVSSNTFTDSYVYTENMTFNRDGSFSGTNVNDGITTTFEGTWNFEGGVGETKNKSKLVLFYTKITEDGATVTIEGNMYQFVYDIDELRNKKIVLKNTNKRVDPNGDSNETVSEMTYEQ